MGVDKVFPIVLACFLVLVTVYAAPSITLLLPTNNSLHNDTAVSYTLNETLDTGFFTWQQTAGTPDVQVHVAFLQGAELQAGNFTGELQNYPVLVDGSIYTLTFAGNNTNGEVFALVSNVTYDFTAPLITITRPLSNTAVSNATVNYSLSEDCSAFTITWTNTSGPDIAALHTIIMAAADETAGNHTVLLPVTLVSGTIYSATFICTDAAGNTGTATSTNISTDATPPAALPAVHIASNFTNSSRAGPGTLVTVSFTAPEPVVANAVIDGQAASVANVGLNYTASRIMTGNDTEGLVQFSIAYTDLAGNQGPVTNSTTDNSSVYLDLTPPNIIAIAIPNGLYTTNSTITVTITADAPRYAPVSVLVNNVAATNFTDKLNGTYTAVYTVQPGDADQLPGAIPVSVQLRDDVGNVNVPFMLVAPNNASIDATAPTPLSVDANPSTGVINIGENLTVTLTFNETGVSATGTVNAVPVVFTTSNTTVSAVYTVAGGDTSRQANALPLAVLIRDVVGNTRLITSFTSTTPVINTTIMPPVVVNSTQFNTTLNTTFQPGSGNLSNTTNLTVINPLNIVYPSGSTVFLPQGTVITRSDGQSIDAYSLVARDASASSITNYPGTPLAATEFGLPGIELTFSRPITISIYNGPAYNGKVLNIYRAPLLSGAWIQTGLSPATCTVSIGLCTFTTTRASYFADNQRPTPITRRGGGGGGGGGWYFGPLPGNATNQTNQTNPITKLANATNATTTALPKLSNKPVTANITNQTVPEITGAATASLAPFTATLIIALALLIIGAAALIRLIRRYN